MILSVLENRLRAGLV